MTLPFKPLVLALLCSAGLLAAAGTLYVKSRVPSPLPLRRRLRQPPPLSRLLPP